MIVSQSNLVSLLLRSISVFTSGIKTLSAHWPHMACEYFDWLAQKLKYLEASGWYMYSTVCCSPHHSLLPPHSFILPLCPPKMLQFGTPDLDQFYQSSLPPLLFLEKFYIFIYQSLLETFSHHQPQ